MTRLVLSVALLCTVSATTAAADGGLPSEETLRAGQVQVRADEARQAGRLDEALDLASEAIGLDPGATTWLAQQIRIEILEESGRPEEAMTCLLAYVALEGLFPEHRTWGDEAIARIGARLAERTARREEVRRRLAGRRVAGGALMAFGAAPIGVGAGFVGNFAWNGSDVVDYGGWLDCGLVLVGVGAAIEVSGVVVALAGEKDAVPPVALGLIPAPDGAVLLAGGRF